MKPFSILTLPLVLVTTALADRGRSVVYWGQGTNDTQLSAYCTPQAGVDMVVLSFLSAFGNGQTIASGNIGPCSISSKRERLSKKKRSTQ